MMTMTLTQDEIELLSATGRPSAEKIELREAIVAAGLKLCLRCLELKAPEDFSAQRRKWDGLRTVCTDCHAENNRDWYEGADKAQIRERDRAYEAGRGETAPLFRRLKLGKVKAMQLGVPFEGFTRHDLTAYWQSVGIAADRCYYTGEPLGDRDNWELDHMTPLSRGGSHAVHNLVPCLKTVNRSKKDRTADEYREAVPA